MILGFKTKFHWGEPTYFEEKIISPYVDMTAGDYEGMDFLQKINLHKIHTIRESGRCRPGMFLHMATGVRTPNYNQFNKDIPELQKCISTQAIRIFSDVREVWVAMKEQVKGSGVFNCKFAEAKNIRPLAYNDGMTEEQFWKWFTKDLAGQIIHWTNFIYGNATKKRKRI